MDGIVLKNIVLFNLIAVRGKNVLRKGVMFYFSGPCLRTLPVCQ